jgi:uncharacterized protein YfaS (alpha-2-macroglobulin family)
VGVKALAAGAAAVALGLPGGIAESVRYLESRQTMGGGFAEPGGPPTPGLTAWAVLALRASGKPPRELETARAYLEASDEGLMTATDVELAVVARAAVGERPRTLVAKLHALVRRDGAIGSAVNSTIWGILAFRALGEPAPPASVRYLLRRQTRSGGWPWIVGAAPDSNDTAAAVQALRAAGVRGAPIRRALTYLRRLQNRDGGFELTPGRGSDVQSTAWAVQAFLAAGEPVGPRAYQYLERMRRTDGSLRYSARYAVTPVWVTAQAVLALARQPLPLRPP